MPSKKRARKRIKPLLRSVKLWSYTGMDTTAGVVQKNFNGLTCLPALIVWASMTTNSGYLTDTVFATDLKQLSDETGLTQACILYLRNWRGRVATAPDGTQFSAPQVKNAFKAVSAAFTNMGQEFNNQGIDVYDPFNCPVSGDLSPLSFAAKFSTP